MKPNGGSPAATNTNGLDPSFSSDLAQRTLKRTTPAITDLFEGRADTLSP